MLKTEEYTAFSTQHHEAYLIDSLNNRYYGSMKARITTYTHKYIKQIFQLFYNILTDSSSRLSVLKSAIDLLIERLKDPDAITSLFYTQEYYSTVIGIRFAPIDLLLQEVESERYKDLQVVNNRIDNLLKEISLTLFFFWINRSR